MTWYLIIGLIWGGIGMGSTSTPMATQAACQQAATETEQRYPGGFNSPSAVAFCVKGY